MSYSYSTTMFCDQLKADPLNTSPLDATTLKRANLIPENRNPSILNHIVFLGLMGIHGVF